MDVDRERMTLSSSVEANGKPLSKAIQQKGKVRVKFRFRLGLGLGLGLGLELVRVNKVHGSCMY